MTGIVSAGIGIGAVIGPPLANSLISAYGWRVSYLILGSIVLIVVVSAAQFLKRDPSQIGKVAYGQNSAEASVQNPGAEGFTFREVFHRRQFWMIFCLFLCFGFCLFTVMVHLVPYATDVGISATSAANVLAAIGAVSIISKVAMGYMGDIIGNKTVLIISFILIILSLVWFLFTRDMWSFYLFAVIFGIAYGSHISQTSPFTALLFGLIAHGSIFGMLSMGMWAGLALGPFVAGYIFDVTGSYQLAFFVCIAVGILGLILTMLVKPISNEMDSATTI
jgi:MFS family permease